MNARQAYICRQRLQRSAALMLLSILLLAGCSQTTTRSDASLTPEQQVAQRVEQRWQLIMEGDYLAAYEYLTPGYRTKNSQRAFANRIASSGVEYSQAEVNEVNCDESYQRCTSKTAVEFVLRGALRGVDKMQSSAVISEKWINLDNQWYFVIDD